QQAAEQVQGRAAGKVGTDLLHGMLLLMGATRLACASKERLATEVAAITCEVREFIRWAVFQG
ncbi:MAG: hypothetical protein ACHQ7M_17545, partial [Chloroflexota bacterium]